MKISVVIPARNEEDNVEKMVKLLIKYFKRSLCEIIVVNDCSSDKTKKILNSLAKCNLALKPLHRRGLNGVGFAIRDGLKKVSKKADFVLMLDCDFVENIEDIKKMIKLAHKYDGLLGSRYIKEGVLKNYPLNKKIANRAFHLLARLILRIPYIDVTNNFKLYRREVVEKILPYLESRGFSINAETGLYPILFNYRLKEVPVSWIGRTDEMGRSHFNVTKAGPGYAKVLYKMIKMKFFG